MTTPTPPPQSKPPVDAAQHEELLVKLLSSLSNPRIVAVAVDASENSEKALDYTLVNIVRKETDRVVLLNVRAVPVPPFDYGFFAVDVGYAIEDCNKLTSRSLLQDLARKVVDAGVDCRAIALRGDARAEIVAKVEELGAVMLVMGSRGMGAIKRTVLGSVSDFCVHNANCPVLVVQPNGPSTLLDA
ncbi:hypothetical protein BDK51DRAFT_33794 [Blyttiomyces helicus]|uniref:UspA domain-containing protein n=1 Tax=Blyttiomyces helicus TaxID=388810 RepID=A0A4P9VV75_9FUNG|nr:hypothetical protein BDK51DRAFT_33794 [Blyttiomyces helicus]|eukprot:RKO83529.1 hypothetical protein BDK51DRAFT_33794 [Blyttiomyces helicus]